MNPLDYLIWLIGGGMFAIVFGYVLVRALTTAHYRSRIDYDRRRAWESREDKVEKSECNGR
jgi:hypothetical protein